MLASELNQLHSGISAWEKEALAVQQKEKPVSGNKCVVELDKFKRRLIRAVARLLLHEKKSEEEVWTNLKKETGCDCQLLWSRMRALTLKKLARLFAADDRIEAIPKAARMSLTDWLLFDLVLVHQKIDLIGLDNPTKDPKDDPKALVDLFELVNMFKIEGRAGDSLAEAWSTATLYYNNQGHQCSPMLLQRRWYQLKEVTRAKFYDFWYSYRGAAKRLSLAERHMPSPLQAAIARKFKTLVTSPFLEWEELIKIRLVTLPEEFEQKMLQKSAQVKPVTRPTDDAPDLVVIEPRIETIDLRLESDNETEKETEKSAEEKSPPPTEVKIKEEPQDIDIDEPQVEEPPKKSKFEIVLESTAIENEKIDNMDTDELELMDDDLATEENEIEQAIESTLRAQEEEPVLPQITNVFGNVSDTTALGNVDKSVLGNVEATSSVSNVDGASVLDNVENTNALDNVGDTIVLGSEGDTSILRNVVDIRVLDNEDVTSARCSSVDDPVILGNVNDTSVLDNVGDTSVLDNVGDTSVLDNAEDTDVLDNDDVTSICSSVDDPSILIDEPKENLSKIDALNAQNSKTTVTDIVGMVKDMGENSSSSAINESIEVPIVEDSEPEIEEIVTNVSKNTLDQAKEVDSKPNIKEYSFTEPFNVSNVIEDAVMDGDSVDKKPAIDIKPDLESFSFGELSNDINFVDDGIEFVDDGIAYHDEDSETRVKTEVDEEEDEEMSEETLKIDEKLLMCPIIYTTKLDDMGLFHDTQTFDHINGKQLLDIVHSRSKPVKNVPVDTNNSSDDVIESSSDEADSDEDEVPDSQKVKESSYLLQKPRCRTYNPIQLCKNPDFNTRLKRLTVGFFSSHRNRVLIKYCKPLTIDLSKAFESKLVSGTLYLKPSDHNVKPEVIDDTEIHQSVSVVPSAMLAQSLIDNSKIGDILPPYRSHFVSPKPPDDLGLMSERNKVINLPDISEIRRINQRLLTAEVTPIQVQNNMFQVPVSIVASMNNYSETPAQKSAPIPETDKPLATDSRGPPKVVVISEDLPSKENTVNYSSTETNIPHAVRMNSNNSVYRPSQDNSYQSANIPLAVDRRGPPKVVVINEDSPVKEKTGNSSSSEIMSHVVVRAYSSKSANTQSQDNFNQPTKFLGRPPKTAINGRRLWPPKPSTLPWKPRHVRTNTIPWLSKNSEASTFTHNKQIEETLLTLDTLNKMLYLLSYDKEDTADLEVPKQKPIKKRGRNSCRQPKEQSPQPKPDDSNDVQVVNETEQKTDDTSKEKTKKCCKPKINIKSATNYPPGQKEIQSKTNEEEGIISLDDPKENDAEPSEDTGQPNGKSNVAKKKFGQNCCWSRKKMLQTLFSKKCIPIHDCPYPVCMCCCRTRLQQFLNSDYKMKYAEKIAKCVDPDDWVWEDASERPSKAHVEPLVQTPVIDVEAATDESTNTVIENEPIDIDDSTQDDVPALGGEVCVTTTEVVSPAPPPLRSRTQYVTVPVFHSRKGYIRTHAQSKINPRSTLIGDSKPASKTHPFSPPTLRKVLAAKKSKMPTKFPANVVMPNLKPFSPPKNFKEKMIFLNSKHISEKPTDNPIFLGKNKILLTTVKFPPNLKQFEEAKQKLNASLSVPNGVTLICLPNGTVTFTIDQNVQVTAEDIAAMPAIVAAVQAQINSSSVQQATLPTQNVPPKVGAMENEIVNLIDDDDDEDATPNVHENKNENSETPPVAEVQNTEVDLTESSDKPTTDSSHTETEEKSAEAAETNQNISADQNTENEIGDNVQESSHNEIPSTSAEKDQPEVSSQNVTTDVQDESTSEPNRVNKSKNILSDLMEMSGIFDEDITPTPEDTLPAVQAEQEVVLPQASLETALPLPVEEQPSLEPTSTSAEQLTTSVEPVPVSAEPALPAGADDAPMIVPKLAYENVISVNSVPPLVKSPIGELSPITSLYELKYACLNNGIFFKLDFETGYLVPINVCMKTHPKQNPKQPTKLIQPKSVIDLTDDDDSANTSANSPNKPLRSLLISNNLPTESASPSTTTGSTTTTTISSTTTTRSSTTTTSSSTTTNNTTEVKPVKLFKALKPSILRRLEDKLPYAIEKKTDRVINQNSNGDNKQNRKQFLRKVLVIRDKDSDTAKVEEIVPKRYYRKIRPKPALVVTYKNTGEANEQPATATVSEEPEKQQSNIDSDDSSDDEPLAKKARRKIENESAPAIPMEVAEELPASNSPDIYMSDNEPDEQETHYELVLEPDRGEEEAGEDENCILGV